MWPVEAEECHLLFSDRDEVAVDDALALRGKQETDELSGITFWCPLGDQQ